MNAHGGKRAGAGRPRGALNKLTRPVKELAAEQGPASIARLVWLRDHSESEVVQLSASRELLDRGFGRARQEIDVHADRSIRVIINRGGSLPTPPIDVLDVAHRETPAGPFLHNREATEHDHEI